jgi:hypothetical protein
MTITLARCDGGNHVHIHKDGSEIATVLYAELLAGTVTGGAVVNAVQALITLNGAADFEAMQAAVEGL